MRLDGHLGALPRGLVHLAEAAPAQQLADLELVMSIVQSWRVPPRLRAYTSAAAVTMHRRTTRTTTGESAPMTIPAMSPAERPPPEPLALPDREHSAPEAPCTLHTQAPMTQRPLPEHRVPLAASLTQLIRAYSVVVLMRPSVTLTMDRTA